MAFCENCGVKLPDNVKFCPSCGSPVDSTPVVASAPAEVAPAVVPSAAEPVPTAPVEAPVAVTEAPDVAAVPAAEYPVVTATAKKPMSKGKKIGLISAIVAVVAALAVVFVMFLLPLIRGGNEESKPYALYLKDGELVYLDLDSDKSEPLTVTDAWMVGKNSSNSVLEQAGFLFGVSVRVAGDNLFWLGDTEGSSASGRPLYFRPANDPKADETEIYDEVYSYVVLKDNKTVLYMTAESYEDGTVTGDLYRYTLSNGKAERIARDIANFSASDDGENYLLADADENYTLRRGDDETELPENSYPIYVSDDGDELYYVTTEIDDGDVSTLYFLKGDDKAKKIATNVSLLTYPEEDAGFYYLVYQSTKYTLADFLEDDMKDADAASLEAPTAPTVPSWDAYDTWDAYDAAWDAYLDAYSQYYDDYDAYTKAKNERADRDELRNDAQATTMNINTATLYYRADGKSTEVTSGIFNPLYTTGASDVIVYTMSEGKDLPKVKISTLTDVDDLDYQANLALENSSSSYTAVKGKAYLLCQDVVADAQVTDDETVYYTVAIQPETQPEENVATYNIYTLYKAKATDGTNATQVDSEVANYFTILGNHVLYGKEKITDDSYNSYYDYYIDGKLVGKTCYTWEVSDEEEPRIAVLAEYDEDKEEGVLYLYANGESEKVDDDVHQFIWTAQGKLLYLKDYDNGSGTLCVYENGESRELDDEVQVLVEQYYDAHDTVNGWMTSFYD